jgi:prepilin-type N-terminal cleavage/methylation domain-containing protein
MRIMIKREGFSLIELLLVVVITGIICGLVLLNASTHERVDAQVEAKRMIRAIHSIRSAWLAYNTEKFIMLGVPSYDVTSSADRNTAQKILEKYSDRSLHEDIERYGNISIVTLPDTVTNRPGGPVNRVYVGFTSDGNFGGKAVLKGATQKALANNLAANFGLVSQSGAVYAGSDSESILIRVR